MTQAALTGSIHTGFASQEDLVELGTQLTAAGYSAQEARALIQEIRQTAQEAVLAMTPKILERVRRVHAARIYGVEAQIRAMSNSLGYVSRDRVLQLLATLHTAPTAGE